MTKDYCYHCYKSDEECKCTTESFVGDRGMSSSVDFGVEKFEYEYIKMDGRIILKIKLWNDVIYLGQSGIEFLHGITDKYLDVKKRAHVKLMKDYDCDDCGEKTNNGQEYCDKCADERFERGCDC